MSTKVRFGDNLELRNSEVFYMSNITVGIHDFELVGSQKECVRWLTGKNLRVKCSKEYGSTVYVTIGKKAPRLSNTILQPIASALGITGPFTMISSFLPSIGTPFDSSLFSRAQEVLEAADQSSDAASAADAKLEAKCSSKKVLVRFASSRSIRQFSKKHGCPLLRFPSGLHVSWYARAIAAVEL